MARLRHGPKFGQTVDSIQRGYDPALDSTTWGRSPFGPCDALSPEKKAFRVAKQQSAIRGKRGDYSLIKKGPTPKTYRDCANAMADRVEAVLEMLQSGLDEMNQAPRKRHDELEGVSRKTVIDAMLLLRKSIRR